MRCVTSEEEPVSRVLAAALGAAATIGAAATTRPVFHEIFLFFFILFFYFSITKLEIAPGSSAE